MGWFEKEQNGVILKELREQVVEFNQIAGKEYNKEFQTKLCLEEAKELIEAFKKQDKVNFLKELADCFVVCSYNPWYTPALKMFSGSLTFTLFELEDFLNEKYEGTIENDLAMCVTDIVKKIDADWKGAFQEVLNSNMSKYSDYNMAMEPEYTAHCKKLEEGGRYSGVTWFISGNKVVWRDGNGKILKGMDYREADVSPYIN